MKLVGVSALFLVFLSSLVSAQTHHLVINEVMYAPVSSTEPEWIELHNMSDSTIDVAGWRISDALRTDSLPEYSMPAKSYVVVTKDSVLFRTKYVSSDIRILQTPLPAFNNDADMIIIHDASGTTSDSISYTDKWGGKSGVSLERRNPEAGSEQLNFGSCLDTTGATPGRQNSIYRYDFDAALLSLSRSSGSNEDLDITVVIANLGARHIETAKISLYSVSYTLPLGEFFISDAIAPHDSLSVSFKWMKADYGIDTFVAIIETMSDQSHINDTIREQIYFPIPSESVVINEIMTNPVSSSNRWIEVFNRSDHVINLGACLIQPIPNPSTARALPQRRLLPKRFAVISAGEKIITSYPHLTGNEGLIILDDNAIKMNPDQGSVMFLSPENSLIDSMYYPTQTGLGISLERRSPYRLTNDESLWAECVANDGATPLAPNSLDTDSITTPQAAILGVSPNPFSPDGDGYEDIATVTIHLPTLSEATITARLYNSRGQEVAVIARDKRMIATTTITVDGRDINGRTLPIGLYTLVITSNDESFATRKKGIVIAKKRL